MNCPVCGSEVAVAHACQRGVVKSDLSVDALEMALRTPAKGLDVQASGVVLRFADEAAFMAACESAAIAAHSTDVNYENRFRSDENADPDETLRDRYDSSRREWTMRPRFKEVLSAAIASALKAGADVT